MSDFCAYSHNSSSRISRNRGGMLSVMLEKQQKKIITFENEKKLTKKSQKEVRELIVRK